jgi:hypothetical protein
LSFFPTSCPDSSGPRFVPAPTHCPPVSPGKRRGRGRHLTIKVREFLKIAFLLGQGESRRAIGERLGLRRDQVRYRVREIYDLFETRSRLELAVQMTNQNTPIFKIGLHQLLAERAAHRPRPARSRRAVAITTLPMGMTVPIGMCSIEPIGAQAQRRRDQLTRHLDALALALVSPADRSAVDTQIFKSHATS